MKSFIEINFIFIITSKKHNLYSHIIGSNYSIDNSYKLNIKQLKLLFTI